jgi:hypothetical protein
MLNNREWAILIWLAVLLVWLLLGKKSRAALASAVRTFCTPNILIPVSLLLGYVGIEVWLGAWLSLWRLELIKETVVWFLATGFALFLNFNKVATERHYFRNRMLAAFGLVVFLEFFTNLFVLNLVAELLLQPFLALLGMMTVVAAARREHRPAKRLAEGLLIATVLALLAFNVQQVVVNWDEIDRGLAIRQLALPMWMTVGLLPFVYFMSLYSNYELAFKWIGFRGQGDRWSRLRAKAVLILETHLRTKLVHRFNMYWGRQAAAARSFRAARQVVKDFREREKAKVQALADAQENLKRYAGVDGEDEDGGRLDRREFKETTDALRWLATCQMGWHRNRGGRYRTDLLERMSNDFSRQGLPEEHGIAMRVRDDGQAWYAWRRTVTGWVFAIGAAGPPPDQWEYDRAEPPSGFPGEDPAWGDGPFDFESSRNW